LSLATFDSISPRRAFLSFTCIPRKPLPSGEVANALASFDGEGAFFKKRYPFPKIHIAHSKKVCYNKHNNIFRRLLCFYPDPKATTSLKIQ
jgi:hypothetical protein